MTTKTKTAAGLTEAPGEAAPWPARPLPPFCTLEERLRDIEALRLRINGHTQFMLQVNSLKVTSNEAKEKAITAFHERMVALERQLGLIQEELRLG